MEAQSVEEVAELLKADARNESKAERVWEEICYVREKMGSNLSLDELEAVAGGAFTNRDWWKDGCAATVEPGSDCLGTDGGCTLVNVNYWSEPGGQSCIYCGAPYTFTWHHTSPSGWNLNEYGCRVCKKWFTKDHLTGEWHETASRIMNE